MIATSTILLVFSVPSFAVTDVFSGDMNNLLLFSDTSAALIPRSFNDPMLLITKQGVSFSGVIMGQVRKENFLGRVGVLMNQT